MPFSTDMLVSSFLTFSKETDLFHVLYQAQRAGVIDSNGNVDEVLLADLAYGIPQLKEFAETNGILVGKSINFAALKDYVDFNFKLRNMLTQNGIINAAGAYVPSVVKYIAEHYNPATGKLDTNAGSIENDDRLGQTVV